MAGNNKIKIDEAKSQINNLKNINAEAELAKLKNKALDKDAHIANAKFAAKSLKDKVMSTLTGIVSVALLGILAQVLFPWWTIAIVGFWIGYWIADTPGRSFFYGFLSMFLVWSIYAGYQSYTNGGLMSNAISGVLGGKVSGTQLIYATGVLGGLVTGLATSSGALLRESFRKAV